MSDRWQPTVPERTKGGHRQSLQHRNCFKGNVGQTPERRGGAHNSELLRAHGYRLEQSSADVN